MFIFSCLFSQSQLADGVLAQVGGRVILYSSVLEESFFKAQHLKINPQKNPSEFQEIFNSILKTKIYNNVVLIAAEKDSSIVVSPDDISKNLDERINHYINQLGSVEALEKQLGMTKGEIKTKHWEEVRDELLISSFQYGLLKDVSVSRGEVVSFFEAFKDSIPKNPSKASFSLIEKKVDFSLDIIPFNERVGYLVDSLRLNLLVFEDVLLKRSVSASKEKTTTLRGDMFPEFERVAFSLNVGEISDPIKTDFGFFIIKLFNRVGEKITTSHILLKESLTDEDFKLTSSYLDSLVLVCKNDPGLFDSLAVAHRVSGENLSGFYENIEVSLLPSFLLNKIINVQNNSFSDVFLNDFSAFILYKYSYIDKKESSLDNNWFMIESLALQKKKQRLFEEWIEDQYKHVYVKINPIY